MAAKNQQFEVLKKNLKDRFWRLNNLYFITNKRGKKVKFRMTPEQYEYTQYNFKGSSTWLYYTCLYCAARCRSV
ncbi:Uncharacterised protein [Providencia heimbachae]|uniref:Phage terminase large subunit n=1 Tax=Providencia heimbachae ATCC 35613 TaxID=1354272 RepID=A0A1B7K099_9GAMM|nr:phage terminase large subunit [Providencia heimbachae ATCC 35613]SQH13877.1 Uncharacterised protein [Providencia heimbachae]